VTDCFLYDNKLPQTVVAGFIDGTLRWGTPRRSRLDRGTENVLIRAFMAAQRGTGNTPFILGSSTHNQRCELHADLISEALCLPSIEAWWRFLWEKVIFFIRTEFEARAPFLPCTYSLMCLQLLESLELLDRRSSLDLWALHSTYTDFIRARISFFVSAWNHHRKRGKASDGIVAGTPIQLFRFAGDCPALLIAGFTGNRSTCKTTIRCLRAWGRKSTGCTRCTMSRQARTTLRTRSVLLDSSLSTHCSLTA